jgi:uncharacterized membrane protein
MQEHMMSTARRAALWILAIGVAGYAIAFLASDAVGDPAFHAHFRSIVLAPALHIITGAVALLVGPFQLSATARLRWPAIHRIVGRIYVIAVLLSSAGGLVLAMHSAQGLAAQLGFATLSLVWAATAIAAVVTVRAGRIAAHRAWMLCNFSLTFAAVNLRIYIPLAMLLGLPLATAYSVIAWACWVPNLIVMAWFCRRNSRARMRVSAPFDRTWLQVCTFSRHGAHPTKALPRGGS